MRTPTLQVQPVKASEDADFKQLMQTHHYPGVLANIGNTLRYVAEQDGHWCVEKCHYILKWNYDEDRMRIRTGLGPENITRLRRFAIGLLKRKQTTETISELMKKLLLNTRAVFDILKMTRNSMPHSPNFTGA